MSRRAHQMNGCRRWLVARVEFTLNGATKVCPIYHFRLEPR